MEATVEPNSLMFIKQPPKVEMWDDLRNLETTGRPRHDGAIAFGQGPVIDVMTKRSVADIVGNTVINPEDEANTWCRTIAIATGYLYKKGEFRELFLSGGQRYGTGYKSEAGHMDDVMEKVWGKMIEDKYHHIEDQATNTLENMENVLNTMDNLENKSADTSKNREFKQLALVCADFHAARVKIMATLYNLTDISIFSAEQVLKVMVHDPTIDDSIIEKAADILIPSRDKNQNARDTLLAWVDSRIQPIDQGLNRSKQGDFRSYVAGGRNISERNKAFGPYEKMDQDHPAMVGYEKLADKQGKPLANREAQSALERKKEEDEYVAGLLSVPANWLGFISGIKNDGRLKGILENISKWNPDFLGGLEVKLNDDLTTIRQRLIRYRKAPDRIFLDLKWKPWNEQVSSSHDALVKIINENRKASQL